MSLATFHYPASRFEREIYDLFGIAAEGHPDPRPLVRHAFWPADYFPLRKDAVPREFADDGRAFPFTEVGGEGVYEIPVGPVHAGVIEPGHFRFSVVGETIIDMKSRLYFTHKGTEKLFEGREPGAGRRAGRARLRRHDHRALARLLPGAGGRRRAPRCRSGRAGCA